MICPMCKGGKTLLKKVQGKGCYEVVLGICDRCHGTGEIEMTNEEYLRSCSTEELAILLCNELFVVELPNPSLACRYRNELFKQYPLNPMDAYYEVMRWLKEIHK